jgi:DNA-binding response OmpR family regulator
MEILIVEDEPVIADFLSRGLAAEGFEVEAADNGIAGEDLALRGGYDLVILDRMLPGRDGIDVLAGIRKRKPDLPVILLTARDDVADRVEGLDSGATDYVTKPFAFDELLARVRAHLRQATAERSTILEAGGIRLDLLSRTAQRDGASVRLPEREASLLAHLMRRAGEVCGRDELLRSVWGYDHDPRTNVVQVYVGYLRRKLGSSDSPSPIETVRSVGYRLRDVE